MAVPTVLEEFQHEARDTWEWLESVVADVTPEQALWQPPGRANTIAATYAHIVRNADEDLNEHLFERPRLNEGPWKGRTGLSPRESNAVEWEADVEIDWDALRDYGRAVHKFVIETIDTLTEEDLTRTTKLTTPNRANWEGIFIVRLTAGLHVRMHGGEIACLKGLQGSKGYRAGLDMDPQPPELA
jgi:hypothetical protein